MDGSSEGDGTSSITSKATSHDPDAFKPWVKEKVLGTGGFGTVTLWKNENSGETVALKKCRWGNTGSPASPETLLSPEHKERWQKEVQIMLRLEHPCVVSCFPVPSELEGGPGDLPILCMEYCSGGDLRKLLNRPENCCGLREVVVRSCLKDLTEAVAYLHSQRIIHRDLKPENIVLQENEGQTRYKLIDLGYAKELEYTSVCTSFVGTLQYLAPELFLSKRYSCTVDYWSLGLVVHEIVTGVRPFLPNMSPVEWMKRVRSKKSCHICVYEGRSGDIHFSERMFDENHISKPLKSGLEAWLQLMLEWEPARRGQVEGAKPDDKKQVVAFTRMAALLNKKIIGVLVVCGVTNEEDDWLLYVFSTCALTPQVAPHFPTLVEEMLRSPRALVEHALQRRMWCHSLYFLYRENKLLSALISAQKIAMLHLLSRHAEVTRCGQRVLNDIAKLQARHHLFMEALNTDLDHYTSQSPQARVSECTNQFPQARVSEYTSQSPQARVSEYTSQSPQARVSECTNQFPQPRVSEYTSQSPQARVSEYTSQSPQARVSEYTSQSPQARVSEYTSQSPQARVTSEKAYGAWRGGGEATLSAVHAAVDKTQRLDAALTALNTKVMELNGSPFSCAKTPTDTLDTIVSSCEELYVSLRRRSRDERSRPHDSTAMCKLLLQALRKRDRLYQDLYTHIEKQWSCLSEVTALAVPLEELLADIARAAQTISSLQQHRQDDIWKIMAIVASHSRGNVAGAPGGDLPRAPAPPQPLTNLALLLEQSSEQTDNIIAENRALRCQMVELLSSNISSTLVVVDPKAAAEHPASDRHLTTDGNSVLTKQQQRSATQSKQNPPPQPAAAAAPVTKTAMLEARRSFPVETAL
ncbi:inhibitor of nuclear factor kappa-B kinase subunit beta [Hyalella azteca]|uniref:IkappaB kinase n=1 Tax=Hyalella azteca TaxID=294128 RepID=A0A979FUM6_HYAAZ|nr:inhibitor of nuclear factor kappa-B kinase subunit beta [Hyalella azteca]